MREIKFRAWDKDNKEMFEPAIQLNDSVYKMIIVDVQEDKTHFAKIENAELMQYTGLKDKNGKEIYEGDIVYGCWYSSEEPIDDTMGVVTYFEGWCAFVIWNEENTIHSELNGQGAYIHTFEVLGNIHENPELLKGE